MRFIFLFFFLFQINLSYAKNLICDFEEVYPDGSSQKGQILLKNDHLRYEYFDKSLYTLLFVNNKLFYIDNINRNKIQLVDNNDEIISELLKIYSDFPNFETLYKKNNYEIRVESSSKIFVKRLIIKSQKLNVSIYFMECTKTELSKKLFNFNPFIEYVRANL